MNYNRERDKIFLVKRIQGDFMQNFNYHTHTYRCKHAKGNEIAYIEAALENGFKHLGFSEHCAYKNWPTSTGRLEYGKMDEYFDSITKAKEKYADQIKIYRGLEIEYFPDLKNYYLELKEKYDYLVLGEHSLDRKGRDIDESCSDEDLKLYCKYVCEAIENNIADYLAHVDYFMLGRDNFNGMCRDVVKEIASCAKAYDLPLELNLKGAAYGKKNYGSYESYIYPHSKTMEVLAEVRPKIVLGYDAHSPKALANRQIEKDVRSLCKEYGLNDPLQEYIIKKR